MQAPRLLVNMAIIGLAYYVGKQIGRTSKARKELQTWRTQNKTTKTASDANVDQDTAPPK